MDYKQIIVVRADLKLPKGKMAAQVAHASVEAVLRADKNIVKDWRAQGMKKIVVKTSNEAEIHKLSSIAKEKGISNAVITDAGKTVVAPGTVTCLGLGPALDKDLDFTEELQLA